MGRWDECGNGRYIERGIKRLDGFGATRWRSEASSASRSRPTWESVGALVEPASVVAKAWEKISRLAAPSCARPRTVIVTGAGPIGLLAALLAAQRGLETHVLDLVTSGSKPEIVAALGATYHAGAVAEIGLAADVVIEATGVGQVTIDVIRRDRPRGTVCLTGVSPAGRTMTVDAER